MKTRFPSVYCRLFRQKICVEALPLGCSGMIGNRKTNNARKLSGAGLHWWVLEAGYNKLASVLQAKSRQAQLAESDAKRCIYLISDARPLLAQTMAAGVRMLTLLMRGAVASAERGEKNASPMAPAKVVAQRCGAQAWREIQVRVRSIAE